MDHKQQSAADERITTLALEIQQHCFDYFDGKLSGQEWLQLVVDAVQQHQAEARRAEVQPAAVTIREDQFTVRGEVQG